MWSVFLHSFFVVVLSLTDIFSIAIHVQQTFASYSSVKGLQQYQWIIAKEIVSIYKTKEERPKNVVNSNTQSKQL